VPAIDLPTLKQHVADRRLAEVYLFVGEDLKLVDRMVDAIESTVDPADRPFAVERVYAGEAGGTPIDIVSAGRMNSSPRRQLPRTSRPGSRPSAPTTRQAPTPERSAPPRTGSRTPNAGRAPSSPSRQPSGTAVRRGGGRG